MVSIGLDWIGLDWLSRRMKGMYSEIIFIYFYFLCVEIIYLMVTLLSGCPSGLRGST